LHNDGRVSYEEICLSYNQNDEKLKFYTKITFISRALPISAKPSANYESLRS